TLTYTGDGSHVSTTTVSAGVLELDGGHLNDVTVSGGKFSMRNNAEVRVLNADGGQVGTPAGRVGTAHQRKLTSEITWLTPIAGPTDLQVVRMDKCTSWKGNFVVTLLNQYVPAPGTSFKVITCEGNNGGSHFNDLPEGATVPAGNVNFKISYDGDANGNGVVLTVSGNTPLPGLVIDKHHDPPTFVPGGTGTYTLTVT